MSKIANLTHVGFSKTGSSFLKHLFNAHPNLHYTNKEAIGGFSDTSSIYDYTRGNELNSAKYFVTSDSRIHCWRIADVNDADNWFDEKDTLEHQKKVCQILRGLVGAAKILIITRGFEGVLKSFYSSYIKRGGVHDLKSMLEAYHKDYIMPAYNYDDVIPLYIKGFGKENVLVLPYELLRDDLSLFLKEIEEFLGIDHMEHVPSLVNESFKAEEIYWYRKASHFVKTFSKIFGKKYSKKIVNRYVARYLSYNRLRFIAKLLNKVNNKEESLEVPNNFLKAYANKANILKNYPFYDKYSKYYFND
jgi:hypothetical protein